MYFVPRYLSFLSFVQNIFFFWLLTILWRHCVEWGHCSYLRFLWKCLENLLYMPPPYWRSSDNNGEGCCPVQRISLQCRLHFLPHSEIWSARFFCSYEIFTHRWMHRLLSTTTFSTLAVWVTLWYCQLSKYTDCVFVYFPPTPNTDWWKEGCWQMKNMCNCWISWCVFENLWI